LKKKIYLYANSTTQRCPKEIMKIFLIENFFHLLPVSTTPVVHLDLRISPRILKKFENQGLGGKLIHVENLKSKIVALAPLSCIYTNKLSCMDNL
jgi:hypothetical protein